MALFDCLECGGRVSDKAKACPHCGALLDAAIPLPSKVDEHRAQIALKARRMQHLIVWSLMFIIFLAVYLATKRSPEGNQTSKVVANNSSLAKPTTPSSIPVPIESATDSKTLLAKQLPPKTEQPQSKIGPYAVSSITQGQYPKAYKAWGKKGIDRINKLLRPGAELIAASPECDLVEYIDLSDRSKAPSAIVLFADCKNGKRFFVTEKEINAKASVQSTSAKTATVSDSTAIEQCTQLIKRTLNFPSTFDPNFFGTGVYRAPTGNILVTVDFEAKNAVGAALPHRAQCSIDDKLVIHGPTIAPR